MLGSDVALVRRRGRRLAGGRSLAGLQALGTILVIGVAGAVGGRERAGSSVAAANRIREGFYDRWSAVVEVAEGGRDPGRPQPGPGFAAPRPCAPPGGCP